MAVNNDIVIQILDPIGPDYVYGLCANNNLSLAGITKVQESPLFESDATDQPFIPGRYYRVYAKKVWEQNFSDDSFQDLIVKSTDTDTVPTLDEVLRAGNESDLNAVIGRLFTSNSRELTDNTRTSFAGINLVTGELVQIPNAVAQELLGNTGGDGQLAAPTNDENFTGQVVTYKGGKYYIVTNDQLAGKILTIARLFPLLQALSVGTPSTVPNVLGIGPTGLLKLPISSLGSTTNNSSNNVDGWIDLPVGNYVAVPSAPRWYQLAILPASSIDSLDAVIIELVGGPWQNLVGGDSLLTRITATFRNRGGFAARYELEGPNTAIALRAFRNANGTVSIWAHQTGSFVVAFFRAHAGYSAQIDYALTPLQGDLPAGDEVFSSADTAKYKPLRWFDNLRHYTAFPSTVEAAMRTDELFIPKIQDLPTGADFKIAAVTTADKKVHTLSLGQFIKYAAEQAGIPVVEAELPQNLILAASLGTMYARVGEAITINVPQNAFTNGTGPFTFAFSQQPPGLNTQNSTLTGTPTVAGTFRTLVTATDINGRTGTGFLEVIVLPQSNSAPVPPSVATIQHQQGQTQTVTLPVFADPNGDQITYSIESLDTNLITVNNLTRQLTIPTNLTPGEYNIRYTGLDNGTPPQAASTTFRVVVSAQALSLSATLNCANKTLQYVISGRDTRYAISYFAPGINAPSDSPGPYPVPSGLLYDPKSVTLYAVQNGVTVSYVFDLPTALAACPVVSIVNPTPPVFSPVTVSINQAMTPVAMPAWTSPGGTLTYSYKNVPPGLAIGVSQNIGGTGTGFIFIGTGFTYTPGQLYLNGTPTQAGTWTIEITGTAPDGGQATGYWIVTVQGVAGVQRTDSTDSTLLQLSAQLVNGEVFIQNTANVNGYYRLNNQGEAPLTAQALPSGPYPKNKWIMVEYHATNTPSNNSARAIQQIGIFD